VKNYSGRAYIKIINTQDTDERIVALEVERLDEIATSRLKNSSSCDKNVQMRAVNAITINNIQSI